MSTIVFVPKQVIEESWIGFVDNNGIETGLIIKKLSDGTFFIPTGSKKKIFTFEELQIIQANEAGFVQVPFIVGSTDFPADDSMKPETFNSFLKAFKKAFLS